jgi:hypothetical protein
MLRRISESKDSKESERGHICRQESADSLVGAFDSVPAEAKDSSRPHISLGGLVDRIIDGMWFASVIEHVDELNGEVKVRYLDDQKSEDHVPFDEIRPTEGASNDRPVEFVASIVNTLAKPLQGLIDDDADRRMAHKPTVVIHSCADSGNFLRCTPPNTHTHTHTHINTITHIYTTNYFTGFSPGPTQTP